jgi:rieske iron-sulfur protein
MKSKFNQERRDLLKSTCAIAGAAAVVSVAGSMPAFAAGQAKGVPEIGDVFVFIDGPNKDKVVTVADVVVDAPAVMVQAKDPNGAVREGDNAAAVLYRVAPDKVPADLKAESAEGVLAYSAVCTHLGCMLSNWDAPTKSFLCPCHDSMYDPLQNGKNTAGATSRTLPHFPIKSDGGKIVVTDVPSGYVGVKRTT